MKFQGRNWWISPKSTDPQPEKSSKPCKSKLSERIRSTRNRNPIQDARAQVWVFSKPLRVIVQMGGCRISESTGILGWYCKISPRSSHPSRQRCCIHSEVRNPVQDTCPKVWSFSTPLGVIVQIGRCQISELAGILGGYCKISPRSSHPSLQRCCIHSKFQNFAFHAASWRRPGSAL